MLIHNLRLVVMTVLALAAIATGAGYLAHSLGASAPAQEGKPPGEPKVAKGPRPETRPPGTPSG